MLILIILDVVPFFLDPNAPNVQVTRMTLVCDAAPANLVLDLQGKCCSAGVAGLDNTQ